MAKKPRFFSLHHMLWLGLKLLIAISVILALRAILKMDSGSERVRVSSRRTHEKFDGPPKIAFLFLARRELPLDFLWDRFFETADSANFSIYIHSEPRFSFDEKTSKSPFFHGRQLNNSIQVVWGEASMIGAERLLLDAALDDAGNQRFVLLSDSCVPLYNFSFVYNYLMASSRSYVDSFLDTKGRYNPRMSSHIPKQKWRKGSQWISLIRSHAETIADDTIIFPLFEKFCKRRPPVDRAKGKLNLELQRQHNCIPDEHYVPTLLSVRGAEKELERRTLTYTSWMENKSWHPVTFNSATATGDRIREMKDIDHVYYETEFRTEWCRSGSLRSPCFLFARKFSEPAALRLLNDHLLPLR